MSDWHNRECAGLSMQAAGGAGSNPASETISPHICAQSVTRKTASCTLVPAPEAMTIERKDMRHSFSGRMARETLSCRMQNGRAIGNGVTLRHKSAAKGTAHAATSAIVATEPVQTGTHRPEQSGPRDYSASRDGRLFYVSEVITMPATDYNAGLCEIDAFALKAACRNIGLDKAVGAIQQEQARQMYTHFKHGCLPGMLAYEI